jgi:hypothetical protein
MVHLALPAKVIAIPKEIGIAVMRNRVIDVDAWDGPSFGLAFIAERLFLKDDCSKAVLRMTPTREVVPLPDVDIWPLLFLCSSVC